MALKLTGNLNVELIEGKYGTFSVGTVTTDLGTFSVKDKVLDQFKPGKYDGEFVVEKIQAESFTTKRQRTCRRGRIRHTY